MPLPVRRLNPKAATKPRKSYPKRASVRETALSRVKTLEYAADPVPPVMRAPSRSNREQKFLDIGLTTVDCNASPLDADIFLLNTISQGTSVNTRIGMRYNMTGIHIRGFFDQQGPQLVDPAIAGYYLVYDSEPHGAKASAEDMFNLRYTDMTFAFPNGSEGQKGGRFKYLSRKITLLGNRGSGTNPVEMDGVLSGRILVNDYIPLANLPVQCMRLNAGATISTIQKGALLLVPFGRNGYVVSGSRTAPNLTFSYRMYFNEAT